MEDLEITLQHKRKNWEEIYFAGNRASYFLSPTVMKYFVMAILCAAAGIYFLIIEMPIGVVVMMLAMFALALATYLYSVKVLYTWKRSVVKHLDYLDSFREFKVVLTSQAMTLISDDVEYIVKWNTFKRVLINDQYILLEDDESFMYPRKSMSPQEYEQMKKFVRKHTQSYGFRAE